MALMTASIQKYKFCEQVQAKHLNCLTQVRNENKAIWEEAKAVINTLECRIKWSEDSHVSIATKATEQEARLEEMVAHLLKAEKDAWRAKEKLGHERNHCITVKDNFNGTLKRVVNKKVGDALEQAHLKVEAKREREKEKL